jgi:RNA recognition motif-containing protein
MTQTLPHTRLYVGDLAPTITEQALRALFAGAGEVVSVELKPATSFAFVQMASADGASQAIQRYNGYNLDGSKLIVYGVPPRSQPRLASDQA